MKTLNQKNNRMLTLMFGKFLNESDAKKKENLQNEIIAKFGAEHFADKLKSVPKILNANVPNASKNVQDALSNENGISDAEINNDLLNALNAIGITDKLKEKGGKSIFNKEYNNKADRTKCRNAFQNALSVYLLHVAHNKIDLANAKLIEIKAIADKYYLAGASFKNKSDYCTDNMEQNKKELIQMFIKVQNVEIIA